MAKLSYIQILKELILEDKLEAFLPDDNVSDTLISAQNSAKFTYFDKKIAIIPGSFKPPHKGCWDMILKYCDLADTVIVLVSNISYKTKLNSVISKTNLKPLASILSKISDKNEKSQHVLDIIVSDVDKITFNELENILISELIPTLDDEKLINRIDKFLNSLREKMFANVKKTNLDTVIEPEMSKEIFDIFTRVYNVGGKIEVRIADKPSPFMSIVDIIQNECENCTIYLGVASELHDEKRYDFINDIIAANNVNLTNTIITYPMEMDMRITEKMIRNNIDKLEKGWFPAKLSETDLQDIQDILVEK